MGLPECCIDVCPDNLCRTNDCTWYKECGEVDAVYCYKFGDDQGDPWLIAALAFSTVIGLFFLRIPVYYLYAQKSMSTGRRLKEKLKKDGNLDKKILDNIEEVEATHVQDRSLFTPDDKDSLAPVKLNKDTFVDRVIESGLGGYTFDTFCGISGAAIACYIMAKWLFFFDKELDNWNASLESCLDFREWASARVMIYHFLFTCSTIFSIQYLSWYTQFKKKGYRFSWWMNISSIIYILDVGTAVFILCYYYGLLLFTLLYLFCGCLVIIAYIILSTITWKLMLFSASLCMLWIPRLLKANDNTRYSFFVNQLCSAIAIIIFFYVTSSLTYLLIYQWVSAEDTYYVDKENEKHMIGGLLFAVGNAIGVIGYISGLIRVFIYGDDLIAEIKKKHERYYIRDYDNENKGNKKDVLLSNLKNSMDVRIMIEENPTNLLQDHEDFIDFSGVYLWHQRAISVTLFAEKENNRVLLISKDWDPKLNPVIGKLQKNQLFLDTITGRFQKETGYIYWSNGDVLIPDGSSNLFKQTERTEFSKLKYTILKNAVENIPLRLPFLDDMVYKMKQKYEEKDDDYDDGYDTHGNIVNVINYPAFSPNQFYQGKRPIRVLSIDGGGLRGVLTCQILKELEKSAGRPLHECFDLIIGTSTGGLISVGLGKLHWSMEQIETMYHKVAKEVFFRDSDQFDASSVLGKLFSFMDSASDLMWNFTAKMSQQKELLPSKELEKIFREEFKEQLMYTDEDDRNGGAHCAVVSVRSDVVPNQPFVFRSYNTSGCEDLVGTLESAAVSPYAGTYFAKSWQAARCTSAAPAYFKSMKLNVNSLKDINGYIQNIKQDDNLTFIDGGIVHNDPCLVGYVEAQQLYGKDVPILMVSVGTGSLPSERREVPHSFVKLSASLFGGLFDAKESSTRIVMRNLLKEGENYFRFCPTVEVDAMAEVQWLDYWTKVGQQYAQTSTVHNKLKEIGEYCSQLFDIKLPVINSRKPFSAHKKDSDDNLGNNIADNKSDNFDDKNTKED